MRRFVLLFFCLSALKIVAQQWVVSYPVTDGAVLIGGDCNGDGNYIVGACDNVDDSGYSEAYAMYVGKDGGHVERRFGFEGYKAHFCRAICLDDGNAFIVGVKGGTLTDHVYDTLWIAVMTPELEIVEERTYAVEMPYMTWTTDVYLEFDNDGDIVVLADVSERVYPMVTGGAYRVLKCDTHGNVLKTQLFSEGHGPNGARPTGLIRVPDSDMMMILGRGFFVNNVHSICYIDSELNKVAAYPLQWLEDNWNYTDCWKENGHFLMSSLTHHYGLANDSFYAAVFEVDATGKYVDTLVYDRADTSDYTAQFGSMVCIDSDVIYIATYWENMLDEYGNDAVICLIDKGLNLKGTKRIKIDDTKFRIMHCQRTSDGGCLVYGQCKELGGRELVYVCKLSPDDFGVSWTLTGLPVASQHHPAYPNPTDRYLNIILDNADNQCVRVMLCGIDGRKRFEHRFGDICGVLTLDVSALENGTYYYEVHYDRVCTQKGKFMKIE